jgi:transcriptional regulator with XRE-family HTH domain
MSDNDDIHDRMSQSTFGIGLAARMDRERAFPAATVSRWESDLAKPDLATISAIARSAKVDPGWLAFGAASDAPSPLDGMTDLQRRYALAFLEIAKQDLEMDARVAEIRKQQRLEAKKRYDMLTVTKKAKRNL